MATAILLLTGTWSASADPYATAVLADNPTAFWQLNETNGTTANDSAGAHVGVYTNVELGEPGVDLGQPGYLPGTDTNALSVQFGYTVFSNSYVGNIALDFATNGNAEFSAEAWVWGTATKPSAGIFGKGPGGAEEFYLDCGGANSAYRFFIRNAAGTAFNASGSVAPDGNWHHLVGVCDEVNGRILLYVDGSLEATNSASGGIRTSANPYMNIGSRQSASVGYDYQFVGYISDVAVYNYALTSSQVATHYDAAGIPPNLISQPTNALTANQGDTISLTNWVTGTPQLFYQWILNGNALRGATNASLTITNVDPSYSGSLYLNVSNAYGTVDSIGTYITINSGAPEILSDVQPSQLALYQGRTFAYSVVAGGTEPLYYQWLQNGNAIFGATNASYTATAPNGTNTYSVLVSNSVAGGSITPSSSVTLTGVAPPTAPYPATIVAANAVAFWRLDEPENSTVANEYMGGHDGTYNNVMLGVPGYSSLDPDTAAAFGGANANSYMAETDNSGSGLPLIDFGASAGKNAEFSVECWVNGPAGQSSSGSPIVCKGNSAGEEFMIDASGGNSAFRFYIREANSTVPIVSGAGKADGNWHHLVGVCDQANGIMVLYVDGNPQGSITGIGGAGIFESAVPVSVGAQNGGTYQFNGTIDEVSLYNYAMTAAQVQAHFAAAPLPPYFIQEPAANVTAYVGQTVTLTATTLGSIPQTNQWYVNNTAMNGQNTVALVLTNLQSGTNTYVLKVSNAYGTTNAPGTVVQVAAGSGPPQLLADVAPLSTTRYATLPITYSVSASGSAPLYYQWFSNSLAVVHATNASYTIASLTTNNSGNYYCLVSNAINVIDSSVANLQVVAAPTNVYPLTILLDHPVAYFRLDEPVGASVGYDYVGGNNGLYTGPVGLNVSGFDPSYELDTACTFGNGTQRTNAANCMLGWTITNVDFSKPNGQNGAFSLEAWINGNPSIIQASGAAILAKGYGNGGEQFSLDAHFGIRFYVRNAAGQTVANAQSAPNVCGSLVGAGYEMDGKWHHLAAVCDQANSNLLLYVDGMLIGPNVITNGVVPPLVYAYDIAHPGSYTGTNGVIYPGLGINATAYNTNLWNSVSIGDRNKGNGNVGTNAYNLAFVGTVDDAAFYNYCLTPSQVYAHYAVGAGQSLPLSIQTTNGVRTITWLSAAVLESASSVKGPWTAVANSTSPYTVPAGSSQQYYRIQIH
jgi:hypothetical protein